MGDLISFGGGVNSVAMTILLVNEGWRGPIVFADTGAEWPETYCYMDYFEGRFLRPRRLQIEKIPAPSPYHTRDLQVPLEEYCLLHGKTPSIFFRWCTSGYKVRPINRWARAHGCTTQFIAFSAEESHRITDAKEKANREYPLVERGITRQGCKDIIGDAGLETPDKSSCFFCPFQKRYRWKDLLVQHPDLFERAINLEENALKKSGITAAFDPKNTHTLKDIRRAFQKQIELPMFEYEHLREFQGCVCGL